MRQRFAGAIVVCLVIGACTATPPSTPAASAEMPVAGGRYIVGAYGELPRLQPAIDGPHIFNSFVYETLAQFDPSTGEVTSGFGSIAQSADGRTYTVDIDERAVWSDGSPVSAVDWITTIKAIARGSPTGDWASEFGQFKQILGYDDYASRKASEITGVLATGRRLTVTLEVLLCASRTMFAAIPPLPTHVFGKYLGADGPGIAVAPENLNPPISSGPFVLKEWRRGDHRVFARNVRYWRGASLLDEFMVRQIQRGTAVDQLASGGIMGITLAAAEVPAVEKLGQTKVYRYSLPGYQFIQWNTRSATAPPLRDRNVRRALAHAVDVERLVRELAPLGTRVSTHIPAASWAFTPPDVVHYDPSLAESLLRAAGFSRGSDGIFAKDGRPLEIRITTNQDNARRVAIFQYVGDQLLKAGVRVRSLIEPSLAVVLERLYGGDWDGWVGGFSLPADPGATVWHSIDIPVSGDTRASGRLNFAALANADLDRRLEDATRPQSGDCSGTTRKSHYAGASRIIEQEQPALFLFTDDQVDAYPADLRGFRTGPHSYRFYLPDIHRWWFARPVTSPRPSAS